MSTRERMTVEQFATMVASPANQGRRLELIDGELHEKPMPTEEHGYIDARFAQFLNNYFDANPSLAGRVVVNARFRIVGEDNARLPDVAVILGGAPVARHGVSPAIPAICIEVKSPDDRFPPLRQKAEFYLTHGATFALIAIPDRRALEVHTEEGVTTLGPAETLTFPALLPGFAVPVASLFPPPEGTTSFTAP